MKKTLLSLILLCTFMFTLTGCNTTKSYTFDVETGDKIKIELNTTDGYDLSSSLPFTVSKDGSVLSQGTFITLDGYDSYVDMVNNDTSSTVLDSGSMNGVTYTFYSYNDTEFNYIIKIDGSNTALLLGNANSQNEAQTVFELLTFSTEK